MDTQKLRVELMQAYKKKMLDVFYLFIALIYTFLSVSIACILLSLKSNLGVLLGFLVLALNFFILAAGLLHYSYKIKLNKEIV